METKAMIIRAKEKGISIKLISEITGINKSTLYQWNSGRQNISKEKEDKVRSLLEFLLEL